MKKILFLAVIIAVGIYGNRTLSDNPTEITDPVYMESRINIEVANSSREFEVVFLGEMVSQDDCNNRLSYYLPKLLEGCQQCVIKFSECKTDIHSRDKKLFSDRKTHTTYLSLTKGNRFERNGRVVVWGLNDEEAKVVCNDLKSQISERYSGTARCI